MQVNRVDSESLRCHFERSEESGYGSQKSVDPEPGLLLPAGLDARTAMVITNAVKPAPDEASAVR